jgi:hypothetical protein
MARSAPMKSYEQFIKFRNLISTEGARRDPPSASAVQTWRDRDTIYRLYGMKCRAGERQVPNPKLALAQNLGGNPGSFTCSVIIVGSPN